MNLDPLSKESNVKTSIKKYFVDALGEIITFDTSLASPDVRTQGAEAVNQWYNLSFGEFGRNALATYYFEIYCLSRQDAEGVKLAEMADTLMELLVDNENQDGQRRIPLFDVSETPWTQIGSMVVQDIEDVPTIDTVEDETKVKVFSVRLRWGARI
ncbi:MAG: hypothetical protein WC346_00200 [Methanogenium sp.]|jgi:hypothetical protein